ncbi:MAG: hypothetical protein C5B59_14220 [Bacteroidetes bacterium]|nr:MAG: hypothetical protein C5B59_14220 [Bacteroidota bacterium]
MDWVDTFFGHGKDLNSLQMSCRAIVIFFITLILLRIAGIRTFGKKSAFDNVIIIMLGSILSRAVVGASPFLPTCVSSLAFVLIHWALGKLSYYFDFVGKIVKGEKISLFRNGNLNNKAMRRASISLKDLEEGLRLSLNDSDWAKVKEMFLERGGEISVVKE